MLEYKFPLNLLAWKWLTRRGFYSVFCEVICSLWWALTWCRLVTQHSILSSMKLYVLYGEQHWLGADWSHNILYCLLRSYMFSMVSTDLVQQIGHTTFYTVFYEVICSRALTWCRLVRRCCRRSGCIRPVPSSSPQGPSCSRPGPCNQAQPAATGQSHESWILTLIPPSGGLYGSEFLVGKLFEVHKGYDNETIIYSKFFYVDS
jgi:hypothetical protein